jgi:hypothetical protein
MTTAFYSAADHLGTHSYFRTEADASAFQAAYGGYILMTTPNRIWRVTQN